MPEIPQRSSMESFVDEHQAVRLGLGVTGLVLVAIAALAGRRGPEFVAVAAGLTWMTAHAAWCRVQGVRSPRIMLFSDITVWGALMLLRADEPMVTTALFAFFAVLTVLFTDGWWLAGLAAYLTGWYAASFLWFADGGTVAGFGGALLAVGGLGVMVFRLRTWLGRLDATRSQMIGTVSHELRNNLTGLIGLTDAVVSMPELEPAEARRLVGLAHGQGIEAADIVEDLLTASRIEHTAMTVHPQRIDLNAEVTTILHRLSEDGRIIDARLDPLVPAVWADPLRTRQVVRNLVSNAARYGGPHIIVSTRVGEGTAQVCVEDDGDGVPEEDARTIFLPYRRSTATRRHVSSIGLGLWISQHLATSMGGGVEYHRIGDSTRFSLTLPLARGGAPRQPGRPGLPAHSTRSRNASVRAHARSAAARSSPSGTADR